MTKCFSKMNKKEGEHMRKHFATDRSPPHSTHPKSENNGFYKTIEELNFGGF